MSLPKLEIEEIIKYEDNHEYEEDRIISKYKVTTLNSVKAREKEHLDWLKDLLLIIENYSKNHTDTGLIKHTIRMRIDELDEK